MAVIHGKNIAVHGNTGYTKNFSEPTFSASHSIPGTGSHGTQLPKTSEKYVDMAHAVINHLD